MATTRITLLILPGGVTQTIGQCDEIALVELFGDPLTHTVVGGDRNGRISFAVVDRSNTELHHAQAIIDVLYDDVGHDVADHGTGVDVRHVEFGRCAKQE